MALRGDCGFAERGSGEQTGVAFQEQQSRGAFLRKPSCYLAGMAIGFALLGVISQQK
jgi:hypothetical protein